MVAITQVVRWIQESGLSSTKLGSTHIYIGKGVVSLRPSAALADYLARRIKEADGLCGVIVQKDPLLVEVNGSIQVYLSSASADLTRWLLENLEASGHAGQEIGEHKYLIGI